MIERLFVGRQQPTLIAATHVLQERHQHDHVWDLTSVLLVVPGSQAGRRLRQIIEETATQTGVSLVGLSAPVTPAELLERLYAPKLPLASPWQSRFAWMQAAQKLFNDETTRHHLSALTPRMSQPQGLMAWSGIAAEAQGLRETAAAERHNLADVAASCDDRRWDALAQLEQGYLSVLAEAGLSDRDDARLHALSKADIQCFHSIFLIGTQDLNGMERAMLTMLASAVCAIIPAPESEQDGFDETGSLVLDFWQNRPIPISEENLHFVEGPADEANTLVGHIAALKGRYTPEKVTVGVGDVMGSEALSRRLAIAGFPTVSPFGRPLSRTAPGTLLHLVHDYLHDNASVRRFAALIRHPDLEQWLSNKDPQDGTLIDCLDHYRTECLIEHFPTSETQSATNASEMARFRVLAARDHVETLVAPFRQGTHPLPYWAEPIKSLLQTVIGEPSTESDTIDTQQFWRSLTRLTHLLHEMRQVKPPLAPTLTGTEALAFVCAEAETVFLPSNPNRPAMAMQGWLELALDDAPVLLLTGLHEGTVPARNDDDGLLPDALRQRWGLADDRRRHTRDAWLLRLMLETRAQLRIVVTRRGTDGSPKMPSRLLFACDGVTAAQRALAFTKSTEKAISSGPLFAVGNARRLPPPRPAQPQNEITGLKVTAFRDYLACPYRFYLNHIVGLDESTDDADEMDPRMFGNLLHPCLEAFARSATADSTDPEKIAAFLQDALERRCGRQFGPHMPTAVRFQVRQAGKRLDAFAHWQAQSVRDGWQIQNDLAERELEAALDVDGRPFVIRGRMDRVDYHPATDRFRVIDYKTGDSGASPEDKHRKTSESGGREWTDLQLPLYRTLLAAQGFSEETIEVGFVLLASDLTLATVSSSGKASGGTGFVGVRWDENDYRSAHECAATVVRQIRAGVFWPPSEPPRFTDAFSGLCLDSSSDRAEWFAEAIGR